MAPGPAAGSFVFAKAVRLRRRAEFLRVQHSGLKISADLVLVLVLPNERADGLTRAGFTVSSKVGNAVVRNRIRRRLRELYRHRREGVPKGLDMVFIARNSAATAQWPTFVKAFEKVAAELTRKFPQRGTP
jgi:ribonuclease P protein component